jgi:hypothetical protein
MSLQSEPSAVPPRTPTDREPDVPLAASPQLDLVRRWQRLLREEEAQWRAGGPRISAVRRARRAD